MGTKYWRSRRHGAKRSASPTLAISVAIAIAATALITLSPPNPANAQPAAGEWVFVERVVNPSNDAPRTGWDVSVSGQSITINQTGCSGAATADFAVTWSGEIPERLGVDENFTLAAAVDGAPNGEGHCHFQASVQGTTQGSWDRGIGGVTAEATCVDPIGPNPLTCTDPVLVEGELTYSGRPGPLSGEGTMTLGLFVLNCGGECFVQWQYEWEDTSCLIDTSAPAPEPGTLPPRPSEPPSEPGVHQVGCYTYINSDGRAPLRLTRLGLTARATRFLAVVGSPVLTRSGITRVADGDPEVLIDGAPVAIKGSKLEDGGVVLAGSPFVFVNGVPAAIVGSRTLSPLVESLPILVTRGLIAGLRSADLEQLHERFGTSIYELVGEATAGSTRLEVDAPTINKGDTVVVSGGGRAELADVVDKGSLILAEPLTHRYPARSTVLRVPDEWLASFAESCGGLEVTVDIANGDSPTEGPDVILGTPGPDIIDGLGGADRICGGGGNDELTGGSGDDWLDGGFGDDKLWGLQGHDGLLGGADDDVLHGNRGNDFLDGGSGADRIFGYAHNDVIVGGPGDDRLHGNFGDDSIDGGPGADRIFGYGDDDVMDGGVGDDLISGNFGDDVLLGGAGNDQLFGADGDDFVAGGPGDDELHGNSSDDELSGGQGNDSMDGGIGTDICDGNSGVDSHVRCEIELGAR